jgi:hypothetical protein
MNVHLLAIQVFLPLDASHRVRSELLAALRTTGEHASYDDKRAFWREVSLSLQRAESLFERGVWDWVTDSDEATAQYEQWTTGTVDDAKAAVDAELPDAGLAFRQGGGARYMFATALFLVKAGGAADSVLAEACDVPEKAYFQRTTFRLLLQALPHLNFATVRADALFVRPGVESAAVTELELSQEHYAYVRRLG